jgi:zinc transport system ATP-binding protein
MSAISIKNLSFSYDKQKVLENINLEINQKDFLAIIGPNGGGKSTLVKNILALENIQEGSISILGVEHKKNISKVGYVPQNTNINTSFPIKVLDVVLMGHIKKASEQNKSKSFLHKYFNIGYNEFEKSCALDALKQVGMKDYAEKKIGSLSGGQRQRVMIARALCNHPEILILDEPTASIDVEGQKKIYDLLQTLSKSISIVVVSHDISVILSYASKVAHIKKTLTYHDISHKKQFSKNENEHFCEVELLDLLGQNINHKSCEC